MSSEELEKALKDFELEKEHEKLEHRVLKEHVFDFISSKGLHFWP